MVDFVPGMQLSEEFFLEEVQPKIQEINPELKYSAGLIGPGSEILGFDTPMSADHHWGPRVMLFLQDEDVEALGGSLESMLKHQLPHRFRGFSTSFTPPDESPGTAGVQLMDYSNQGPVNHRVEVLSFRHYIYGYIGVELDKPLRICDWLVIPEQKLRSLKSGKIFRDNFNLFSLLRKLDYYPHDLWLYLLASCWTRIEQEEHLMGRAGSVGDELGSALIAARLVRDLMRLSFLMEKEYAPYAKWFGTAFNQLDISMSLKPHLESTLAATSWSDRERCLSKAYGVVAEFHNQLNITPVMPVEARKFHDRPFKVISMGDFSSAIKRQIKDPEVLKLTEMRLLGNVDMISDSTDVAESIFAQGVLKQLYI